MPWTEQAIPNVIMPLFLCNTSDVALGSLCEKEYPALYKETSDSSLALPLQGSHNDFKGTPL